MGPKITKNTKKRMIPRPMVAVDDLRTVAHAALKCPKNLARGVCSVSSLKPEGPVRSLRDESDAISPRSGWAARPALSSIVSDPRIRNRITQIGD